MTVPETEERDGVEMEPLTIRVRSLLPGEAYNALRRALMPFYRGFYILLYRGNRFTCPCCGKSCRRFIPRKRALRRFNYGRCPHCFSYGRHRLIWLFLGERTPIFSDRMKVLHIAPEPFMLEAFGAMPNLDYVSADLSNPGAKVRMDITAIPFDDDTFDAVLCVHVFEHIEDDRRAMREIYRVLKPGGWAVLQSPIERDATLEDPRMTSARERRKAFGQWDHVRSYGRDYFDRLREAGFEVAEEPYASGLPPAKVEEYGLGEKDAVHFCVKPPPRGGTAEGRRR